MTMINWLMLLKEIITVYSENYTKPINTPWENAALLNVMAGGKYRFRWALKS
jgi:hypothetical protein